MIPSVAGCTTGPLCPRCPYIIRDEVLSLYQAEVLSSKWGIITVMTSRFCIIEHYVR
jgi:hypothetical protein